MSYGVFATNTPVRFNSLEFRDGQQSMLATRVKTKDMLPFLERMDKIGFENMEMWGGATFDVCIRYLNDDPWERLRKFKAVMKNTPLKMVCRGQNLVGYKAYPDDIVRRFIGAAARNGIDIFLIFDALEDLRNCETAFDAALQAGKKVEGSIQYNISPFHTDKLRVQNALEQQKMGAFAIHIEDMAGLMTPGGAYSLVSEMKAALDIPVYLHCHCTGGMAEMCYWEAIRAGVDGVDVTTSPLGLGPSLPAVESLIAALRGTPRDPGIDLSLFNSLNNDFKALRKKYAENASELVGVDVGCLQHQIPGGMLTNLESQLKAMNAFDRLPEVLEEAIQVRADMGYPPLATPSSQMCGQQATTNVLTGKRYGTISKEMKEYCRGMYGKAPGPLNADLVKKALGEESPISCRPADLIPAGWDQAEKEVGDLATCEEDVLTYALFPTVAPAFLEEKKKQLENVHKYKVERIDNKK
ncbi:MAG: pyruvate carboxylase subunit B [Oscillospiraceae bacterium]|nr:pyruvate carboxylase subunit B [Oscillospiraceae bacterium]MBO7727202.1 pyruvate carboxylase subunit B [Oscillospiraceae bacterium]MBP5168190.1 pyruvate carboxylase subunit B [Oscillospiraceae bacterium]